MPRFGGFRLAWTPVLITYFCYGASAIAAIADVYFQKETLGLTPADVAGIAFWLSLPWSMKMVAGVSADVYPLFGSRRAAYLLLGVLCTSAGYAMLATTVAGRGGYLFATVLMTVGYMVQDVIADALSVEIAQTDEEIGQIQTYGRMALLAGGISVGYLSGWLAATIGNRATFGLAAALPLLVVITLPLIGRGRRVALQRVAAASAADGPLGGGRARLVLAVGLGYAGLSVALELLNVRFAQELVLVVSAALIGILLKRVGISRGVAIAAIVIFLFRATPSVGQGYSYWAIDKLGFDQRFLGLLAQVSSVLSLAGLVVFRKSIVKRPVSYTLFWVMIVSTILYLPNVGLFYGLHDRLGISARTLAFIDTTISAPLGQLTMVPMLVLIARSAPVGAEATMFAIMASLMNLALSASQLFTRYLNTAFDVTQQDYSNLGLLMIAVGVLNLLPIVTLPLLRREERLGGKVGGGAVPDPVALAGRPTEPPAPGPGGTAAPV